MRSINVRTYTTIYKTKFSLLLCLVQLNMYSYLPKKLHSTLTQGKYNVSTTIHHLPTIATDKLSVFNDHDIKYYTVCCEHKIKVMQQ